MSVSTASNGAINIYLTGGALDRAEKMLAGVPGGTEKAVKSAMSRAVSSMRSNAVKEIRKEYDIGAAAVRSNQNIKSLRSHLDGIMFRSTHCFEIRAGCGWCVYTARLCGTYPVQAREGAIYNFPVVVETEHGGEAYTMPLTGQPTAGTFPAPAVQGVIAGENVAVATAEDGQTYTSPMTGYATVGTHPAAAVQGSILDGVLMTDTASGSAGFEATPCGLDPGSLF